MEQAKVLERIETERERYIGELEEFLRIPSVSTDPRHKDDVRKAADWVREQLKRLGFSVEVRETGGHPIVVAHRCPHPDRPTLLIYGHYDVQPPDPEDQWQTPPFSPVIREGFIYARGATDDKGQLFTHLKAVEATLAVHNELPINIKFLLEGEEEIGSPSLGPFLEQNRDEFAADMIAISDTSQFDSETPAITYGLRGLCYMEVRLTGPRIDLHSGSFGGVVINPVQALSEIIAQLKHPDGRIAIPGFYDDVLDLKEWEREEMAGLAFDEEQLKSYLGMDTLPGEPGYSVLERKWARPTLDVNGIWGGFSGEGAKTVIPSKAGAKVSMRLVPNQPHRKICDLFSDYVHSLVPAGVHVDLVRHVGAEPVLIHKDRPEMQAAVRAIETGFGKPPVFIREGGSIPIINLFQEILGVGPIMLLGWGHPDDGAHSPNERFSLDSLHCGTRAAAALLHELAR